MKYNYFTIIISINLVPRKGMKKGIIILLGPPGVGKTNFGRRLQDENIDYFSSGVELVANDELNKYMYCTTQDNRTKLDKIVYDLIDVKCKEFKYNDKSVLILDCIKELAHGYRLISLLEKYGFSDIRTLYLVRDNIDYKDNPVYQKRIKKWENSKSDLLKLFSNYKRSGYQGRRPDSHIRACDKVYGKLYKLLLWNDDDIKIIKFKDLTICTNEVYRFDILVENNENLWINKKKIKKISQATSGQAHTRAKPSVAGPTSRASPNEVFDEVLVGPLNSVQFACLENQNTSIKIVRHGYNKTVAHLYNDSNNILKPDTIIHFEDFDGKSVGGTFPIIMDVYFKNCIEEYDQILVQLHDWVLDFSDCELQNKYYSLKREKYDTQDNMIYDINLINEINNKIKQILHITRIEVTLPSRFLDINDDRQIDWIVQPGRYYVTYKCDGIRYLLIKLEDNTYLRDRSGNIYSCNIYNSIPSNTILDGELVKIDDIEYYFVFDVLSYKNNKTWHMPLKDRLQIIKWNISVSTDKEKPKDITKSNTIILIDKQYYPLNNDLSSFFEQHINQWYPTDGIIFTLSCYIFGNDEHLIRWQSLVKITVDEKYNGLIYELSLNLLDGNWIRTKKRFDKSTENHPSIKQNYEIMIEKRERVIVLSEERDYDVYYKLKNISLYDIKETIKKMSKENPKNPEIFQKSVQYTLDTMSLIRAFKNRILKDQTSYFEYRRSISPIFIYTDLKDRKYNFGVQLFIRNIKELVNKGYIEENIDETTQLSIFNYKKNFKHLDHKHLVCRGLVIYLPTNKIVAWPISGFCGYKDTPKTDDIVEATIKMDGSLVIVFIWKNELQVTTRRRMNSEQAIWAKKWLINNVNIRIFKPDHTYMFECIYSNNRVVINYAFEGLVLLTVNKHLDRNYIKEFTTRQRYNLALDLGVPTVHQFIGSLQSFIDFEPISLTHEGWVIRNNNNVRSKMVTKKYKECNKIITEIHPLNIWKLIYCKHFDNFKTRLPIYLYDELNNMMDGFKVLYENTRLRLKKDIQDKIVRSEDYKYNVLLQDTKCHITEDIDINILFENIIFDNYENIGKIKKIECTKLCENIHDGERIIITCNCKYKQQIALYNAASENKIYYCILRFIKPTNQERYYIPNYIPSENFQQTYSKGWKNDELKFDYKYGEQPFNKLNQDNIYHIFKYLDIKTLLICSNICIWMNQHIASLDQILQCKQVTKKKIIADRQANEDALNEEDYGYHTW